MSSALQKPLETLAAEIVEQLRLRAAVLEKLDAMPEWLRPNEDSLGFVSYSPSPRHIENLNQRAHVQRVEALAKALVELARAAAYEWFPESK